MDSSLLSKRNEKAEQPEITDWLHMSETWRRCLMTQKVTCKSIEYWRAEDGPKPTPMPLPADTV